MSNKYLEKIAASRRPSGLRKVLDSTFKFIDDVKGNTRDTLIHDAAAYSKYKAMKKKPKDLYLEAEQAKKDTRNARVKAFIGAGALGGAGFLGLHKYRQHQDDVIMGRISHMYKDPTDTSKD